MTVKITPYDTADFLDSEEMIQSFLEDALLDNDPAYVAHALGVVARARGMTQVAKDANLSRESLYKALSPDGNPALNTILRVFSALGMRLSVTRAATKAPARRTATAHSSSVLSKRKTAAQAKPKAKRTPTSRVKA
ncbi:MAG TPA: putative addiction module antidote protein [Rhodospirillaceae bacterium]|nr:putative addiction module antidote protein [Rhodospirillaceae bacterium]